METVTLQREKIWSSVFEAPAAPRASLRQALDDLTTLLTYDVPESALSDWLLRRSEGTRDALSQPPMDTLVIRAFALVSAKDIADLAGRFEINTPHGAFKFFHKIARYLAAASRKMELLSIRPSTAAQTIRVLIFTHVPPARLTELFVEMYKLSVFDGLTKSFSQLEQLTLNLHELHVEDILSTALDRGVRNYISEKIRNSFSHGWRDVEHERLNTSFYNTVLRGFNKISAAIHGNSSTNNSSDIVTNNVVNNDSYSNIDRTGGNDNVDSNVNMDEDMRPCTEKSEMIDIEENTDRTEIQSGQIFSEGSFLATLPQRDPLEHLVQIGQEVLVDMFTDEIFTMVESYPRSLPSLNQLKFCMKTPAQRQNLANKFIEECQEQILHPGANTIKILHFYTKIIHSMLTLGPSGVLLNRVAVPIRSFLRNREDTIQQISQALMSELVTDDTPQVAQEFNDTVTYYLRPANIPQENFDDLNWTPDPIDASPDFQRSDTSNDIVANLLSIYDSRESFVRSIHSLLSKRLLEASSVNLKAEKERLEQLALRFGKNELSMCWVMIRDIENSVKAASQIKIASPQADLAPINAKVLSKLYWPEIKREELVLPDEIDAALNKFSSEFSRLKKQQHLNWIKEQGFVSMDIELGDRTLSMDVTPLQAAIIFQLSKKTRLALNELCTLCGTNEMSIRRAMSFWMKQKIVAESPPGIFVVIERLDEMMSLLDSKGTTEDDAAAMYDAQDDKPGDSMSLYWPFIQGMLTNIGVMNAERIHQLLGMFVPPPNAYNKNINDLKSYLSHLVKEGKLEFSAGNYKLKK